MFSAVSRKIIPKQTETIATNTEAIIASKPIIGLSWAITEKPDIRPAKQIIAKINQSQIRPNLIHKLPVFFFSETVFSSYRWMAYLDR